MRFKEDRAAIATPPISGGLLLALCLGLLLSSVTVAQTSAPTPSSSVAPQPATVGVQNSSATSPLTSITRGVALPESLTAVHGYQGVLAETLDGTLIASQSPDEKFNPASAVKLATAFAALKNLGPNHRFLTSVWANGNIEDRKSTRLNSSHMSISYA